MIFTVPHYSSLIIGLVGPGWERIDGSASMNSSLSNDTSSSTRNELNSCEDPKLGKTNGARRRGIFLFAFQPPVFAPFSDLLENGETAFPEGKASIPASFKKVRKVRLKEG